MTTERKSYPWQGQDVHALEARRQEIFEECDNDPSRATEEQLEEVAALFMAMRRTAGAGKKKEITAGGKTSGSKKAQFDAELLANFELDVDLDD